MVAQILVHIFFIIIGFINVEKKASNWFSQLFWGIVGAGVMVLHTYELIKLF